MEAERPDDLKRTMAACRRAWVGVAVFSACLNMLMLSVPLYMMQLYDRVLATRHVDTLLALTVMVAAALLILGLLDALRGRIMARVGGWLHAEMGGPLLSSSVADALRAGGAPSAPGLRDLATVRDYLGGPAVMPMFDAPWAPVFLAIIFLIHPVLGWIGLGGGMALLMLAMLNDWTTRRKLAEARGVEARALTVANAAVRNADAVAAMGMTPNLVRRRDALGERGGRLLISATDVSGSISAAAKVTRYGLQVAMLGVGAYLVILQEMTPGAMIAGAIILARGLAPVEQLISSWRVFTGARAAYRRLGDLMARAPAANARTALPRPSGRIDFEQVTYAPPGAREPLIRHVSFRVGGGETVGVIGPSGAGKTTLVRLVVGSLTPTAGHVRLDGAEMTAWSDADRARYVGYLPQNVELFPGTVRENLARLGDAEDEDVIAAAKLAGVHETILRLPGGYDTLIGAGGIPISGGQRQRIGLARAVFGSPALLVLDEPNAHLDADGERALLAAVERMRERGVTIVLIAHRVGILARADKILAMHGGTITAFGPRDEVFEKLRDSLPQPALRLRRSA